MTEQLYFNVDGRRISYTSLSSYLEEHPHFSEQEAKVLKILHQKGHPMTARMIHDKLGGNILISSVARIVNNLKGKRTVVVKQVAPCKVSGRSAHYVYFPEDENDRGVGGFLSKVDDDLNESNSVDVSDDLSGGLLPGLDAFDRSSPVRTKFQKYKVLTFEWIETEGAREKRMRKSFYPKKYRIVPRENLENGKQVSKYEMTKLEFGRRVGSMDYLRQLSEIMKDKGLTPAQLLELIDRIPGPKKVEQGELF